MKTKTRTSVDDAQDDRDIVEFRQAWKEPSGMSEELEARLRFERLIADLSLKFINLPANEIPRLTTPCAAFASASAWTWLRFGSGRPSLPDSLR